MLKHSVNAKTAFQVQNLFQLYGKNVSDVASLLDFSDSLNCFSDNYI